MNYKALVLDLDGTTIPSKEDGIPSEKVLRAVNKAKKKIYVCVSTSRPLAFAHDVIVKLEPNGFCVVNDSTQIYNPRTKTIKETLYINPSFVRPILKLLKRFNKPIIVNDGSEEFF